MRPVIAIFVLAAACGGGSPAMTTAPATVASTSVPAPATSTSTPASAADSQAAAASFLDAVATQLVGTAYEGQALEAPEVFLATGMLFCDQLDAGASSDELLSGYVEELSGAPIDVAADDDLVLAGSLHGAAVGELCPHHASS